MDTYRDWAEALAYIGVDLPADPYAYASRGELTAAILNAMTAPGVPPDVRDLGAYFVPLAHDMATCALSQGANVGACRQAAAKLADFGLALVDAIVSGGDSVAGRDFRQVGCYAAGPALVTREQRASAQLISGSRNRDDAVFLLYGNPPPGGLSIPCPGEAPRFTRPPMAPAFPWSGAADQAFRIPAADDSPSFSGAAVVGFLLVMLAIR